MLKSLQFRLILSYVLIIVVCLVLVGLAALVLLRGYQRDLTFKRLADRGGLAAQLTATSLRRGASPQDAVGRLAQYINRGSGPLTFIYLLDSEGWVITGSNSRLDGQRFEQLALGPELSLSGAIRSEWRLAGGERLLYIAELVRVPGAEGQQLASYVLILGELYRPARLALGDLLPRLMWAGAIALALSVIVAALIAYSIARPLDRIARAAEEVAAGNYDQELNISDPTEVARLAASFNTMTRRVKTTLQSQQDLVANVSHELKTPLTSIQGFSQALLDGTARDQVTRERAASIIHEEAGRMRRLVDDLLDLARLESGQVTLAREPVDVEDLLRSTAERFALRAEQANVMLVIEIASDLPYVVGDADRLGQVFGNLVDNALKHVRGVTEGGRIVLRADKQERKVVCSVSDNGSGIPAEDLPRIFERFYQVDKARVRRKSGAGLGLSIAYEIIQAHGGQIGVESVEGLGTRFKVELPVSKEH